MMSTKKTIVKDVREYLVPTTKMKKSSHNSCQLQGRRALWVVAKLWEAQDFRRRPFDSVCGHQGWSPAQDDSVFEEDAMLNVKDNEETRALWGEVFNACVEVSLSKTQTLTAQKLPAERPFRNGFESSSLTWGSMAPQHNFARGRHAVDPVEAFLEDPKAFDPKS